MNLIQNGGIYMKKFVNNNLYLFSLFFPLSLLCHPRALFLLRHPRVFFYYVILYYLSSSSGLTRGSIPYYFLDSRNTSENDKALYPYVILGRFFITSSSGLTRGSILLLFFWILGTRPRMTFKVCSIKHVRKRHEKSKNTSENDI